jgi:hypothetical protein
MVKTLSVSPANTSPLFHKPQTYAEAAQKPQNNNQNNADEAKHKKKMKNK